MKNRYEYLLDEIDLCKPKTIVEIGTYNGDNAIRMCKRASLYNHNITYYGFDLFAVAPKEELPKFAPSKAFVSVRLAEYPWGFHLVQGNTNETLAKEVDNIGFADFIYIDGGHSTETILNDWSHCKELMQAETVVVFDDYYHNRDDIGAKFIVEALKNNPNYKVEFIGDVNLFYTEMGTIEVQMVKVTYA